MHASDEDLVVAPTVRARHFDFGCSLHHRTLRRDRSQGSNRERRPKCRVAEFGVTSRLKRAVYASTLDRSSTAVLEDSISRMNRAASLPGWTDQRPQVPSCLLPDGDDGLLSWRRYHGELAANVISTDAASFKVAVWHEASGIIRQLPRVFRSLESAQAAADDLLRRTFDHKCTADSCSTWGGVEHLSASPSRARSPLALLPEVPCLGAGDYAWPIDGD
jgi:hypothetical protein